MAGTINRVYGQAYKIQGINVKLDTAISTSLLN